VRVGSLNCCDVGVRGGCLRVELRAWGS